MDQAAENTAPDQTGTDAVPQTSIERLTVAVAVAAGRAFSLFTAKRQRARRSLYGLSMSGLGGCRRKAAYQLAGIEPSDPEVAVNGENRPANLGTMIHEGYLPELAEVLGASEEIEVELRVDLGDTEVVVPGRCDLYWPAAEIVLDLKTVGEHKLGQVVATGPYDEHRLQVAGYAMAAEGRGLKVSRIGWIYLDRGMGGSYVVIEEFTDLLRQEVIDKVGELANYALDPHSAPRDGPGPGDRAANMICNGCPWLRECWGEDAQPGVAGAQAKKVEDFGGMQEVLIGYLTARDAESAAKERKEFYRQLIIGNKTGTYGKARWYLTKSSKTVDKNACAKIVEASGSELPTRSTEPRMVVAWVPPDQTQGAQS